MFFAIGRRVSWSRWAAMAAVGVSLAVAPSAPAATLVAAPVATGLNFPTTVAVAPDGRIFFGEVSGRIGIVNPTTGGVSTFATLPIPGATPGRGIMSLAFHPAYPSTPYLYVSLAREVNGAGKVQLLRLTNTLGVGTNTRVLFSAPAGSDHNASRVAFGGDGRLYLAIGDAGSPSLAQKLSSPSGKILRMTATGGVPSNNPWGTRVWAYGVRNTLGMAFDPLTKRLWEADNGPACNDEVNRLVRGANFGWGAHAVCTVPPKAPRNTNQDGPSPILPRAWYATPLGPTGASFCSPCSLGAGSNGAFFFGAWNTGEIRQLVLDAGRYNVSSQSVVYDHPSNVLAVESDHQGGLLFTDTSAIYRLALP
jgi:glucose/arabinose dehydrogenase